jgi:hypothetical protein
MNMLSGIRMRAIIIALLGFYVAPLLPLIVLTSIPNFFGYDPTQGHSFWQTPVPLIAAWLFGDRTGMRFLFRGKACTATTTSSRALDWYHRCVHYWVHGLHPRPIY